MPKLSDLSIEDLKIKIQKTKSFASMIKSSLNDEKLLDKINKLSNQFFISKPIIERLYSIKFGYNKYPKCIVCSNDAKLISGGWSDFCDGNCGYIHRWDNIEESKKEEIFKKLSFIYQQKTDEEKNEIKEKRSTTLISRYGVDHNFKISDVIQNRKNTWLSKYGYDNPNKSETVKKKIIKTNNEKYGSNSPLQNKDIKSKAQETLYKNYKVDHNMKSERVRKTFRDTCNLKYGKDHYMQNEKEFDRISKRCYKWKEIILNQKTYKVQGYEDAAINYLIYDKGISESSFIISQSDISKLTGNIMWVDINGKSHRYYPDFFVTENNTVYEIKSEYTYKKSKNDGSLDAKLKACKDLNLKIKVLVFNKNKKLIKEI